MIGTTITGAEATAKELTALKAVAKKQARAAIGECTKRILRSAKGNVPQETGLLRKSLGRKVKTYRSTGAIVGIVGPRTGFGVTVTLPNGKTEYRDPTKYAHLVENGHIDPVTGTHVAPQPFLRPALEEERGRLEPELASQLDDGFNRGTRDADDADPADLEADD